MIPRLQPRPSLRRPSSIENLFPVDANNNISTNIPAGATDTSTSSVSTFTERSEFSNRSFPSSNDDGRFSKENMQSFKGVNSQDNPPLSPSRSTLAHDQLANSPVPNHYGNQYKHLLLNYSSSTSNSLDTDNISVSYSDFSLTPPTAGSRPPLLVSAKRYGSEVRRQHNKRRRRRRRPSSTRSDSQKRSSVSGNSVDTTGRDSCKENDNNALCLWKGDSPGEAEYTYLPLLASSDEEDEERDRIEEVVRAEHLKEAMVARGLKNRSFSANRAPPPKGCLSNPRPKRPRGHTTRYKTPQKSTDELDALSESNVHLSRRVQFGIPSAVEYEIDRPPGHLTPMSQEVTRKRYSMDPKESTREEDEITQETKQNNLILSEWEDQFSMMRNNINRSCDRSRSGSSSKRDKRNRRSSSIFSPASRISLAYDNSNHTNRDAKEKDDAFTSSPPDSKLAMVTTDSTSLVESSSHATSQATPMSTARRADENQTWDFVADLGSINSKGAMELSPHSSSPRTIESACGRGNSTIMNTSNSMMLEENSQPPADVNLDTINTLRAAIDDESPNQKRTLQTESSSSDSSLSCCAGVSRDKSSNTISKILIATPWLDQEWDFVTLLRNLSFFRRNEEVVIQRCFTLIDPCIHNALYYTSAFVERVMRTLSLNSRFPGHVSNKNSLFSAKNAITSEWKEIGISFIENLTNLLDQFRFGMEKTNDFKKMDKYLLLANDCSSNSQPGRKQIEREISKLENDVHLHESSLDVLEASMAPTSCILCQATAQIGIYGFNFKEFRDDHILELDYMHAIFDVKTRVVVDINSQSGLLIEHNTGASNREHNSIFDFHRGYINMLRCGEMSFKLNCNELQDSLLRLGQILGKLDQCALTLKAINDGRKATITVDSSHIRLAFPAKDTVVSLTLDLECFVTKIISVSTIDGRDVKDRKTELLSSVDCCNLRSLSRIISHYA